MFKFFVAFLMTLFITTQAFAKLELTESNHILMRGEIDELSVSKVIQAIITSKNKEVVLFIDSPGGSVMAGYKLMKVIENSGKEVTCIASNAASMAFAILQSCHKRLIMEDSLLMQHVVSYGLQGREPNNYQLSQLIHRLNKALDKRQAKRIGLSYDEFRNKVRDDWWLWGEDAIKENVADGMIEVSCSEELSKKTTDEVVIGLFSTVTVTWSGCPLAPAPVNVRQTKLSPLISDQQAAQDLKEILKRVVSMEYFGSRLLTRK